MTAEGAGRPGHCLHFTVCRPGPWANHPAHLESKELDQMISRALLENILGFSQPLIWPLIERTFPALLCLDVLS